MKSRYIQSKTESEKIAAKVAREEIERQKAEFCPKCQARMEQQTIAVICKALNTRFGFGKKRLQELISCSEGLGIFLHDSGSDYQIAVDWLRDKIGIDLEKE